MIEHNVLRGSAWTVRGAACELRYNLIQDPDGHSPIHSPGSGAQIHHNVVTYHTNSIGGGYYGEETIYMSDTQHTSGVEIFNNTFDMGGSALRMPLTQPFVKYEADASASFLKSCRNNIISHLPFPVAAFAMQEYATWPSPIFAGLGYEDYNCWFNPEAKGKIIAEYESTTVAVAGKTYRKDPGFGYHDLPVGGAADVQVDPKFGAAKPDANVDPLYYPQDTTDPMIRKIEARQITVSEILHAYRAYYVLQSSSPCIDAGDPADGTGTDIGAIDGGVLTGKDKFGAFPVTGDSSSVVASIICQHVAGPQLLATLDRVGSVVKMQYTVGGTQDAARGLPVFLGIYLPNGRLAASLVKGSQMPGTYQMTWDASRMPSGMYFVRLRVGNDVSNTRALLTK